MNGLFDFFARLVRGVLKLVLGVAALVFVLSLLLATLVVVLGVSLWALITGRKPAPVMVFNRFRQTSQRYTQGVWPGRGPGAAQPGDVVDVQAHEVPDAPAPRGAAPRSGGDPMARVIR
ncbi:MAG: hypothetical protein Q8Q78_08105 [Hydrogenophaga sp.]|nr:hypothetical protein [Hydrogenophaga sp.]